MKTRYLSEIRQTLWLALPFIANQILQMSVATIDIVMAGADSDLTLAAVSQGMALWLLVILGIIGLMIPMSAMVANAFAQGDYQRLRELFQQSVWVLAPLGIIGALIMWFMPQVMTIIGVQPEIIPPATDYLHIVAYGVPFVALFLPVRFVAEGIAFPKSIMVLTALSMPINIAGNYILLNGLFGLPKMGPSGIALSTVISQISLCAGGWWFALHHKRMQPLALLRDFSRPIMPTITRFFKVGLPSCFTLLMEAGIFTVVILLAGTMGVDIAAANQIAINYASNAFMVPLGLSMALTTRVGMAMGNNDMSTARIIGISGTALAALFMAASTAIVFFFAHNVASWYTEDSEVIAIAISLLTLVGVFQVSDGVQVCACGALRGLEETKYPMWFAGFGYWILGIPLAIILAFYLEWGAPGLWWGLAIGLSATAVLNTWKFISMTSDATERTNS